MKSIILSAAPFQFPQSPTPRTRLEASKDRFSRPYLPSPHPEAQRSYKVPAANRTFSDQKLYRSSMCTCVRQGKEVSCTSAIVGCGVSQRIQCVDANSGCCEPRTPQSRLSNTSIKRASSHLQSIPVSQFNNQNHKEFLSASSILTPIVLLKFQTIFPLQ